MRLLSCALAMVILAFALGACGKSSEDKAQASVCDARADIGKQLDDLKSLTPATFTTDAVTKSLTAIRGDLKDITDAQSELSGERRGQAQAATKAFGSSVQTAVTQALSSLSASDTKAALTTALQQLQTSYKAAFSPVDCS